MSNELDFPLRIYEKGPDEFVLLVPHEPAEWGNKKAHLEKTNKTRSFCNWIRKQFPDTPTEFRYMRKERVRDYRYRAWSVRYKTINTDKHFVAYGLTKNQMLMIKLAWVYKSQPVKIEGLDKYQADDVVFPEIPEPTEALVERMKNKKPAKSLDEL